MEDEDAKIWQHNIATACADHLSKIEAQTWTVLGLVAAGILQLMGMRESTETAQQTVLGAEVPGHHLAGILEIIWFVLGGLSFTRAMSALALAQKLVRATDDVRLRSSFVAGSLFAGGWTPTLLMWAATGLCFWALLGADGRHQMMGPLMTFAAVGFARVLCLSLEGRTPGSRPPRD